MPLDRVADLEAYSKDLEEEIRELKAHNARLVAQNQKWERWCGELQAQLKEV